jgi:hypothetical protein
MTLGATCSEPPVALRESGCGRGLVAASKSAAVTSWPANPAAALCFYATGASLRACHWRKQPVHSGPVPGTVPMQLSDKYVRWLAPFCLPCVAMRPDVQCKKLCDSHALQWHTKLALVHNACQRLSRQPALPQARVQLEQGVQPNAQVLGGLSAQGTRQVVLLPLALFGCLCRLAQKSSLLSRANE